MRLLVCGGRDFGLTKEDRAYINREISRAICWAVDEADESTWLPPEDTVIIEGGARGVDSAAHDWAVVNWVTVEEYKADWDKYGKAAGHIRNKQMLEEGKPDLVLAFPGGKGTANMVEQAKKAGIPVIYDFD